MLRCETLAISAPIGSSHFFAALRHNLRIGISSFHACSPQTFLLLVTLVLDFYPVS